MDAIDYTIEERNLPVADGMALGIRDYQPTRPTSAVTVIYLPGFLRAARDFDRVATRLAYDRRVLEIDTRGRGKASRAGHSKDYHFDLLVADVWKVLDHLGIDRVVVVGVALGAFMAWQMASERPERIAGIVANDTGTETSSKSGKKMIAAADADAYTFDAAVDKLRTATAHNFPDFGEQDWRNYARQVYTGVGDGKYVRNFDALFLEELARFKLEKESFWDEFVSLRNLPIALLRGVNSDYFTSDQARKMAAAQPLAELVEVGGRGHPLLLDEPQSLASIRKLLTMADQGGNKASAN